jgi:hypothetical protein
MLGLRMLGLNPGMKKVSAELAVGKISSRGSAAGSA